MADQIALAEQFEQPSQQREADTLGMWAFLATEVMLFGGLFMAVVVYRVVYPEAVKTASQHLYLWLGGLNTAVLLTSSLTMALAVLAARQGRRRDVVLDLLITAGLGVAFIAIKGTEYALEYREGLMLGLGQPFALPERGAELFLFLYFAATGLHALHLLIGICLTCGLAALVGTRRVALPKQQVDVEMVGLFWHLIDIVWIFLYPVLYMIGGG